MTDGSVARRAPSGRLLAAFARLFHPPRDGRGQVQETRTQEQLSARRRDVPEGRAAHPMPTERDSRDAATRLQILDLRGPRS